MQLAGWPGDDLKVLRLAQDAGKVVSLEGTVEIGRASAFTRADVGSPVRSGDTVRTRVYTGKPARVWRGETHGRRG